MKFVFTSVLLLCVACASQQPKMLSSAPERSSSKGDNSTMETATTPSSSVVTEEYVEPEESYAVFTGVVRLNKMGCPVLIEVDQAESVLTLYPTDLAKELQVEGKKIKVSYKITNDMIPIGCLSEKVGKIMSAEPK